MGSFLPLFALLAQTAAEPPPAGWERGADLLARHAEQSPNIIFPLLSIIGLLAIIIGAAFVYVRYYLPTYREQKQLDREHLATLVAQRGKEAQEDLAAGRELAKTQQAAIVEKIGDEVKRNTGQIERLGDRLDKHGDLLRSVATKVGAGVLMLLLCGCAAPLAEQQDLAARVHKATVACTALPATTGNPPVASAQKAKVCTQALLCQGAAKSAADALQAANTARSTGATDVAAEAKAAGLSALAETACKLGGW